ncbi:PREDICTED: phosphate import ATP-binding protein PstB-like [Acropora digitifera]|uniref:phosphate import ATP-binding protein PstB-like n=1 Tax=Acropora digitifera TaxID=70779 RepID=UPI00077AFA3C|nr:PREDICTED: phosphate import ATP-binding protein PstB-like [Acropora digitifera]
MAHDGSIENDFQNTASYKSLSPTRVCPVSSSPLSRRRVLIDKRRLSWLVGTSLTSYKEWVSSVEYHANGGHKESNASSPTSDDATECFEEQNQAPTKKILKKVSAYFNTGELVAIMGPSGCGKTTLLDLLTGRRRTGHIEGQVYVNGVGLGQVQDWYSRKIGYVLQLAVPYYEELTVRQNLFFAAHMRLPRETSAADKYERVEQIIAETGLTQMADTVIGGSVGPGLSGGQKRRLCVALQLINMPSVLFLDEPTSGRYSCTILDPCFVSQREHTIMDLLNCPEARRAILDYYQTSGEPQAVQEAIRTSQQNAGNTNSMGTMAKKTEDGAGRFNRIFVLEGRTAEKQSLGQLLYFPLIFFTFGIIVGTVYFEAEERDGILLMSAYCVYCCASPLFLSSVLMAHLNKALNIYHLERADGCGRSLENVVQTFVRTTALCVFPVIMCSVMSYFMVC